MRKYQALRNNHSAMCAGLQQTHKGMSGAEICRFCVGEAWVLAISQQAEQPPWCLRHGIMPSPSRLKSQHGTRGTVPRAGVLCLEEPSRRRDKPRLCGSFAPEDYFSSCSPAKSPRCHLEGRKCCPQV